MIPEFPKFKAVELSDRDDVEKITHKHPPYSDFNFVSMWSWDIKGEMLISLLNENLVVRFTDYITGKPFYSFLGTNKVNETAQELIELSHKEGLKTELKLVPEETIKEINSSLFKASEERDHFDYIYSIPELKDMAGGKFARKRNQVSVFIKNHPEAHAETLDLKNKSIQGEIVNLSFEWMKKKKEQEGIFESHEEVAVSRLLLAVDACNLVGVGVFMKEKMIGFIIDELAQGENVVAHGSKTDKTYVGVNSFLIKKNAEALSLLNKLIFNYEQDLGMENLRDAKTRFRPTHFLKKYKLTPLYDKVL